MNETVQTTNVRLAMWSGPRNVSTALMRSFEARSDSSVVDEPFYAHYLFHTKLEHPGAEEVIEHHETDWHKVVRYLTGPIPHGKRLWYQKQMTHHMLPHIDLLWALADEFHHAFLIRRPHDMLLSLSKVLPDMTVQQTGLPQQVSIFETMRHQTGRSPSVIDSADLLDNPKGMLQAICDRCDLDFQPSMLQWPSGPRETDGVWGKYWYRNVYASSGFETRKTKSEKLDARYDELLKQCQELYAQLAVHRIQAT